MGFFNTKSHGLFWCNGAEKKERREMDIMTSIMENVASFVDIVNTFLWDYALLVLLLGTGIIYS